MTASYADLVRDGKAAALEYAEIIRRAPFYDPKRDRITLGMHRLCREPKSGRIVAHAEWEGIQLAEFQPEDTTRREWRVLEPVAPIKVASVRIGPGEGRIGLADRVTTVVGHYIDWPGWNEDGKVWINAIGVASTEMMSRASLNDAPRPEQGGYLKTDFVVTWEDGSTYEGRFDLQRGGTDAGIGFRDSLTSRLAFYGGISCPAHFESLDQYIQCVCQRNLESVEYCRRLFALAEL